MASRRSRTRRDKRQPIPRRKACRFESGPGHHRFLAMVFAVLRKVFRIKFGFVSAKPENQAGS